MTTTCFFHAGGFVYFFLLTASHHEFVFNHGGDIEKDEEITCELLYKVIDEFKPFWLVFGSHHLVLMSNKRNKDRTLDLTSVIMISPMGSTVPQTLYEDLTLSFSSLIAIFQSYSMGEMLQRVTFTFDVKKLGFIWPGIELKIVDTDNGNLLGPNEVGEIMVKSLVPMKGYLNRPQENEKFFSKDGFVHTGDLASYAENGMLKYEGRLKELIKYKYHHVYPLEIENVICKHAEVMEAAVFGRPDPSARELVTAVVIKTPNSDIKEEDIIEFVDSQVDEAKQLRGGIIFVDKLPKNTVGKIQRKNLLELYEIFKKNV